MKGPAQYPGCTVNGNSGNCSHKTINGSGLGKQPSQSLLSPPSFPTPKHKGQIGLIGSINNSLTVSKMTNYHSLTNKVWWIFLFNSKTQIRSKLAECKWNGVGLVFSVSGFPLVSDETERPHRKWIKTKEQRHPLWSAACIISLWISTCC